MREMLQGWKPRLRWVRERVGRITQIGTQVTAAESLVHITIAESASAEPVAETDTAAQPVVAF